MLTVLQHHPNTRGVVLVNPVASPPQGGGAGGRVVGRVLLWKGRPTARKVS
jgi:hypothetical protein